MKNLYLLLSLFLIISCKKQSKEYAIEFNIEGLEQDDEVFLVKLKDPRGDFETAFFEDSKVIFNGVIEEPQLAEIQFTKIDGSIQFYLDFGKTTLNTSVSEIKEKGWGHNYEKLKGGKNNQLFMEFNKLEKEEKLPFLLKNKNSIFALDQIAKTVGFSYPVKDFHIEFYNQLNENLKNSNNGKILTQFIKETPIEINDQYVDIIGKDLNDNPIHLSDYDGKVILLDFWASWCPPCIQKMKNSFPKIKQKYPYLEIVSFSMDDQYRSWKNASDKINIDWVNFSNLKGSWRNKINPVKIQYDINSLPTTFLIDPSGKIIADIKNDGSLDGILSEYFNNSKS